MALLSSVSGKLVIVLPVEQRSEPSDIALNQIGTLYGVSKNDRRDNFLIQQPRRGIKRFPTFRLLFFDYSIGRRLTPASQLRPLALKQLNHQPH